MKRYNISFNLGKVKYVVNYHDGAKLNPDGSPFYDLATFTNKRGMDAFVRDLNRQGYIEEVKEIYR